MATLQFDWADFYKLAYTLDKGDTPPSDQALWRTVAGRSYFAAYHEGTRVARQAHGYKVPSGNSKHAALVDHLEGHHDPSVRALGAALRQLKELRQYADYQALMFSQANARRSVKLAHTFLDRLKVL